MPRLGPPDIGGKWGVFRTRPRVVNDRRVWGVDERFFGFIWVAVDEPHVDGAPMLFSEEQNAARWIHSELQKRTDERAHLARLGRVIKEIY